jgi:hypothetical protein
MAMRLSALVFCLAIAPALGAQSSAVELMVIDDATDAALADARVSVIGQPNEGVTDTKGRFVYAVPHPGRVVLLIRRLGYKPGTLTVDVAAGDTARVTFAMTAAVQTLAKVDVRDTMTSASPFLREYERRLANHAGSATFIPRTEIEKRKPSRTTDLLRRVSSLTIVDSAGILMAASRRMAKPVQRGGALGGLVLDLAPCPLQVAVDGQLKEWGYAVNSIPPEEIHGIEVYPGPASIPAEYASMRRDANCGLIMIWTRRDK